MFTALSLPTSKPFILCSCLALSCILHGPSIAGMNIKDERRSPYLRPLCGKKNLVGLLLIRTEYFTVEMLNLLHFIHLSSNLICMSIDMRWDQFNWSKSFSTSSLHSIPLFQLPIKPSFAMSEAFVICLLLMKAFCRFETCFPISLFSLSARTLMILYKLANNPWASLPLSSWDKCYEWCNAGLNHPEVLMIILHSFWQICFW